ncbi:MAG: radical SAM protein [Nitrospirae bacterium]|nr:radical SAM protein [Nitrospirota bacterium]MBI3594509.1 radical SAM protein [Nitrospirota bacterium]
MIINEIFYSIQGESTYSGLPCVFVRTTGCHLRCSWCDTEYAFEEGKSMSVEEIIDQVEKYGCRLVEVTGGEPLLQKESFVLMKTLLDRDFKVLLETSGAVDIGPVDPRVRIVMDVKCPGSHMADRMIWKNFSRLKKEDELKFVVANLDDYEWAKEVLIKWKPDQEVIFSPVFGQQNPRQLAEWILADRLPVRLQLQLHKEIWSPEMRGV